jgi:beta-aspartyl-dipeptidase (metallo-type)
MTPFNLSTADFAVMADYQGLFDQVSFSSDAGGSLLVWNPDKSRIVSTGIRSPDSLLFELSRLVNQKGMRLEKALFPRKKRVFRITALNPLR